MKRGDIKHLLNILCVILEEINLFNRTFLAAKNVLLLGQRRRNDSQANDFAVNAGQNCDGVVFLVDDILVLIVEDECTRLLIGVHMDMASVVTRPGQPIIPDERSRSPRSHDCARMYNLYFFF